jgi:hypothetical protein
MHRQTLTDTIIATFYVAVSCSAVAIAVCMLAACSAPARCTTDTECMEMFGGYGDPEPRR